MPSILFKFLTITGFLSDSLMEKYGDFDMHKDMTRLIQEGKLKVAEQISTNLADTRQLLVDMLASKHTGKPVIVLSED